MTLRATNIDVYCESGQKRTFACAVEWPGWSRSGRDEASALEQLAACGSRYANAVSSASLGFVTAADPSYFAVVERVQGNATTDFGAPDAVPAADREPLRDQDLLRFEALLRACWSAFDRAVESAIGHELRTGPRGGGRDLDRILRHVLGADKAYLAKVARNIKIDEDDDPRAQLVLVRQADLDALAAARDGLPERGPRGGLLWTPRTFVRRVAWHVLDHAWEIEDRIV